MKKKRGSRKFFPSKPLDPLFFQLDEAVKAKNQGLILRLRNILVEKNMGLVYQKVSKVLSQQEKKDVTNEDLNHIGAIGLIKAVERFDPYRKNAFSSFAVDYIFGEIQRYFRDRSDLIRLPQIHQSHVKQFKQFAAKHSSINHDELVELYAKEKQISKEKIVSILEEDKNYYFYSIDNASKDSESGVISEQSLLFSVNDFQIKSLEKLSWSDIKEDKYKSLQETLHHGWLKILSEKKEKPSKEKDDKSPLPSIQLSLFNLGK